MRPMRLHPSTGEAKFGGLPTHPTHPIHGHGARTMDTEETFDARGHTPWRKTQQMTSLLIYANICKYMQISYPIYQMIEISVMYISICHLCVYIYEHWPPLKAQLVDRNVSDRG